LDNQFCELLCLPTQFSWVYYPILHKASAADRIIVVQLCVSPGLLAGDLRQQWVEQTISS